MFYKLTVLGAVLFSFVGCQPLPTQTHTSQAVHNTITIQHSVATPDGVKIIPYTQAEITREKIPLGTP